MRYRCYIEYNAQAIVHVDASSEEEAKNLAEDMIWSGEVSPEGDWEVTDVMLVSD